MAERKIVGWFYRNGKRIPIFEKVTATQRRELSNAEYKTAMRNSDNPNLTSAAVMGMHPDVDDKIMMSKDGIYRSGKYEDYNRAKDLGWEYEGTVSDAARKAGVFDDKPRNKGIRRDPDPKTLRENIKLKGKSERASRVKDASFTTRVERDVMENPGDYGILHHEPKNNYRTNRFGKPYEDNERGGDGHWDVNRNGNPIPARTRGGRRGRSNTGSDITKSGNHTIIENQAGEHVVYDKRTDKVIGTGKTRQEAEAIINANKDYDTSWNTYQKRQGVGNKPSNVKRGEGKLRAHYQDDKAGAYYKDYNSTKDMNADIAEETKSKTTDLITTKKAGIRSARRKTPTEATIKKPVATGKGSLRTDNSEMRRRMWGTPGVPGKEKPTLDIRGKRRSFYDIPQRRAFAGKPIEESYIKYVMKEYGFSRADAIRLIKDKREGK